MTWATSSWVIAPEGRGDALEQGQPVARGGELLRGLRPPERERDVAGDGAGDHDLFVVELMRPIEVEHELAEQATTVDHRDKGERLDALLEDDLAKLVGEARLVGDVRDQHRHRIEGVWCPRGVAVRRRAVGVREARQALNRITPPWSNRRTEARSASSASINAEMAAS